MCVTDSRGQICLFNNPLLRTTKRTTKGLYKKYLTAPVTKAPATRPHLPKIPPPPNNATLETETLITGNHGGHNHIQTTAQRMGRNL